MYALRDRLTGRVGVAIDDIAFGWLVVTPDVDLAGGFEWDDEAYCGRGPFSRSFVKAVDRARKYWMGHQPDKRPINKDLRGQLIHELRPSFDRSPLLDARASLLDAALVRLTDEQYARLDLISEAPRVLCNGGAGTGKTFLAAEVARRQGLTGRRVLSPAGARSSQPSSGALKGPRRRTRSIRLGMTPNETMSWWSTRRRI